MFTGVALLAAATRPSIGRGSARLLDWSLLSCLIAAAAQLIPLQAALRDRLSPHALAVDRIVGFEVEPATRAAHALSIDVESGVWALALGAAYVGLFWCARAAFSKGHANTIRGIAFMGTALTAPASRYSVRRPLSSLLDLALSAPGVAHGPFVIATRSPLKARWRCRLVNRAMARTDSIAGGDGAIRGIHRSTQLCRRRRRR